LSATCKDLLQRLLVKKPSDRLSPFGITQHSWMKAHYVSIDTKKPNWSE
jgi:serine/threonine protein kinase